MGKALSKSRYLKGRQCPKLLWWSVHEPEARELTPDPSLAVRMESGRRVGELARAYVPGGRLIEVNLSNLEHAIRDTQGAIQDQESVIYEACFRADGLFVAIDILERCESGWAVVEVKSSQRVKPHHITDLAIQVHVARAAGLKVIRAEIMHLSKHARYPDLDGLFVRSDQTDELERRELDVALESRRLLEVLDQPCPDVEVGDHCRQPYECAFWRRCWPEPLQHPVSELYRLSKQKREELEEMGVFTIDEVPQDYELNPVGARQRQAILENRRIVDPTLKKALAPLEGARLAFLDFESIGPAVPAWSECQPHQPVPVQMSCHALDQAGQLHHREWLAEGRADPRPGLARAVVEAAQDADFVLAYFAPFERKMLLHLARVVPRYTDELKQIADRLFDLLPVVRNHVYHPSFAGSFSLKKVYPGLVGGAGYASLEVQDGGAAAYLLEDYLVRSRVPVGQDEASLRSHLLAYCKQDTQALVELLDELRRSAEAL